MNETITTLLCFGALFLTCCIEHLKETVVFWDIHLVEHQGYIIFVK